MHIKTEPCPDSGPHETYHVIICEDDAEETPVSVLGHITRADDGSDSWALKLSHPGDDSGPVTFKGATIDDVAKAMGLQFTHVKVNANRLGLGVMSTFVDDLMDPVIVLAEQTGSVTALIHALVHVMARVIATRLPDRSHTALLELITRQLKRDLTGFGETRAMQKQFADTLRKKFEEVGEETIADLLRSRDDEDTPKH
jgi:hypothetical protein